MKVGGAQERVMQSLEAATTLGGDGGPGNAAGFHTTFNINVQFTSLLGTGSFLNGLDRQHDICFKVRWFNIKMENLMV